MTAKNPTCDLSMDAIVLGISLSSEKIEAHGRYRFVAASHAETSPVSGVRRATSASSKTLVGMRSPTLIGIPAQAFYR
jgi:hypothetical protein